MSKKRTKKYLKKLNKAMQENNRYLAGIMDLMTWKKMEEAKKKYFCEDNPLIAKMSLEEARKRGLI